MKFGGGFYCGLVEVADKDDWYIFNGFFMSMQSKFSKPGTSIHYYVVEWELASLSWADFRGKVLGPNDPSEVCCLSKLQENRFKPRVVKQNRGFAGEGIWIVKPKSGNYCKNYGDKLAGDDEVLGLMEANNAQGGAHNGRVHGVVRQRAHGEVGHLDQQG